MYARVKTRALLLLSTRRCSLLQCLYFRELYAFDTSYTNVALYKPVTGSQSSYTDAAGIQYTLSMGNDNIIDMDNATGNMVNFPCDGSGWWQVDLGGVYQLTRLIFFNRYPGVYGVGGTGFGLAAGGAQVTYMNYYGSFVGSYTLGTSQIQSIAVVTVPPTPTITATPSSTATPSNSATASGSASESTTGTPSPSVTPSNTASPSASESAGALPSATASPSFSISVSGTSSLTLSSTPSTTPTITATPSITPSALSLMPGRARITTTGGFYGALRFFELFVFSPTMQLLSASVNGGVASASSVYQSIGFLYGPQFGNDMQIDLSVNETGMVSCAGAPTGDWWQVTWPVGTPVALIYFVNRYTETGPLNNLAITNGTGTVTVYSQSGTQLASAALLSNTVTTIASGALGSAGVAAMGMSTPIGPGYPNPADPWQSSFAGQNLGVRYLNITNAPGQFLHFRELFVFDTTWTNVALNKPVTSTPMYVGDPTTYLNTMGNNGIIDYDPLSGDMIHTISSSNVWWCVDLGGVYNVTRVVLFNRNTQLLRMQGATLTYLNGFGLTVGTQTLSAGSIQTYDVNLYPPTASQTASATATSSRTASSTTTPTLSNSPPNTASATLTPSHTASPSNTPSHTASPSATITSGGTPSSSLTMTPTASLSPSVSATPSASLTGSISMSMTMTPTGTPAPSNAVRVRVNANLAGQCLNFIELFVFDHTGKNIGATAAGATVTASSVYGTNVPQWAADFNADSYVYEPLQQFYNDACSASTDYYQVLFPPGPGFPGGMPSPVAQIIYANRMNANTRITASGASMQMFANNGTMIASAPFTSSGTVSVFNFTMPGYFSGAPLYKDPTLLSQTSTLARTLGVRYVRIVAGAGSYINFRELMVGGF